MSAGMLDTVHITVLEICFDYNRSCFVQTLKFGWTFEVYTINIKKAMKSISS